MGIDILLHSAWTQYFLTFLSIVWLDVVLSGDNALVIGIAASTLERKLQRQAIVFGLVLATVIRIICAIGATYLLGVPGLLFVGGLALLWVAWRLLKELMPGGHTDDQTGHIKPQNTLGRALFSITLADLSMSIDNVLAVAGLARSHVELLVFGLVLSIALMGLGASLILRLMRRYPWISYAGVAILFYIGVRMVIEGWPDLYGFIARMSGVSA